MPQSCLTDQEGPFDRISRSLAAQRMGYHGKCLDPDSWLETLPVASAPRVAAG